MTILEVPDSLMTTEETQFLLRNGNPERRGERRVSELQRMIWDEIDRVSKRQMMELCDD